MTPRKVGGVTVATGLIVAALGILPAEGQATSCGSSGNAASIQAKGVTCAQAKKVVNYDLSASRCKGQPCTFNKVGVKWSCVSHQSGRNTCNGQKTTDSGTQKVSVTFQYAGGEH